jgi:hypothetical protein
MCDACEDAQCFLGRDNNFYFLWKQLLNPLTVAQKNPTAFAMGFFQ